MQNLIWKEWQETKIYLCIFSAWMVLAACYAIAYELGHHYRAAIGSFSSLAMLYTLVAAIILASRISQGEQTKGTLTFTKSLPVSIHRVATLRIIGAIVTLSIPILVAACLVAAALATGLIEQAAPRLVASDYLRLPQRSAGTLLTSLEQLASVTAIAVLGGVELLIVLSLCGCWLRSQAQVAFLGTVLALGSVIAAGVLWSGQTRWPLGQLLYGAVHPQSLIIHWGYGDVTSSYSDHELAEYRWLSLAMAIPLLAAIARCFVLQYGKDSSTQRKLKSSRFGFEMPSILSTIALPLPTRWIALVWLELRQSLPLACYGLLFAALVTTAVQMSESGVGDDFATSFRSRLPHSVFFVGMLWAVVVGSALYSADLDSDLGGFRRTRPISHAMWFWNKFFIGLVAVLLVLDGVTILVSWSAPRQDMTSGMSYAYIACFPIIHAFMFSLAVLGTCLFRRPLIGGVFALMCDAIATLAIEAFPAVVQLEPMNIYNDLLRSERAGRIDLTEHGYLVAYGVLAASAVVCGIVAFRIAKPFQSTFPWLSSVRG